MTPAKQDAARLASLRDRLRRENEELRGVAAAEQRRYVDLFQSAPDAYVVTDRYGKITEANRSAEALIGVSRRFLLGKPIAVYLGGTAAVMPAVRKLRRGGAMPERELVLKSRQRPKLDVGVTASALYDDSERVTGVRWLLRDISLRKDAEAAVRRLNAELENRVRERTAELESANIAKDALLQELAQRARVEREFVTNAAHELRTPVAAIASAVEVLESGAKERPADRDRFLAHLGEQCRRLERLSHALLVLARAQMSQEPLRVEPIGLASLLESVAMTLPTRPGVSVRVTCPPGVTALANADLLEQAVVNVAGNAAKYVDDGEIELVARSNGKRVLIAIKDYGPGMSEEERARAFERFHRGEESGDGFGLGLSIAAQAVEVLGGSIAIDSALGAGTTVRLSLPRA